MMPECDGFASAAAKSWIDALGGQPAQTTSFAASSALVIGRFRFGVLNDEVEAPRIPLHYISVCLSEPIRIEARLEGPRVTGRLGRGQSMILGAGRANAWRWNGVTEEAHVFLVPQFLDEIADDLGAGSPELLDRMPFCDARLRETILSMADEIAIGTTRLPLFLDMAAAALGRRLLRHCIGGREVRSVNSFLSGRQLRRVLSVAEDRLGDDIGLADLADAAGMSRFQFIRAFKSSVGMSPYRWLTRLRIEKAKHLLIQHQTSILEVATNLGFESQSHFGQVFQLHVGMTPTAWRRAAS